MINPKHDTEQSLSAKQIRDVLKALCAMTKIQMTERSRNLFRILENYGLRFENSTNFGHCLARTSLRVELAQRLRLTA
jgi:hypothetical protein